VAGLHHGLSIGVRPPGYQHTRRGKHMIRDGHCHSTTCFEIEMLPLEESIAPLLKLAGFTKKSRTWWRQNKETIQVFNLQKSSAGTGLLFNLGIYVRLLGNECNPPAGRCHIQARLEGVTGQQEAAIILAAWAGSSKTAELTPIVLRDGVGWLDKLSTVAGIRQHVGSGLAERILVVDAVRELIAEPA